MKAARAVVLLVLALAAGHGRRDAPRVQAVQGHDLPDNVTSGWADMRDVPELGDPVAVQMQAAANANATRGADYSIKLD